MARPDMDKCEVCIYLLKIFTLTLCEYDHELTVRTQKGQMYFRINKAWENAPRATQEVQIKQ